MVPEGDQDDARTVNVKGSVYALAVRPGSEADPKVKVKGCAYALAVVDGVRFACGACSWSPRAASRLS